MSVKLRRRELAELAKVRIWHRTKGATRVLDRDSSPHTVVLECEQHPNWWLRVNGVDLPSVVDKALGHIRDTHL